METSGTVCYYDSFGCVGSKDAMSIGTYSTNATCTLLSCCREGYTEEVTSNGQSASYATTCLGCTLDKNSNADYRGRNNDMPRQFKYGCFTACCEGEE